MKLILMLEAMLTLSRAELFFLPADTPATAPAQWLQIVRKGSKPFSALVRLVQILPLEKNDAWLYFRDEGRADDEIISGGRICLGCKNCDDKGATTEFIAKRIARSSHVSRYWAPPNGEFGIELHKEGQIVVATKPHDRNAHVRVGNPPDGHQMGSMARWPNSRVEDFCQELLSRDDSPLKRFFDWRSLSDAEQKAAVSTVQHGDWEEMIQMLQLALELRNHAFGLHPYDGAEIFVANLHHQKAETPADKYLFRWRDALLQIFAPAFLEETLPYVGEVRQKLGLQQYVSSKSVPTHHEALEAQVQLREFLAPHLSKGEIEALFRVDNL